MLYYQGEREVLRSSRLGWHLEPRALRSGELAWRLDSSGQQGRPTPDRHGVRIEQRVLELLAVVVAEAVPAWRDAGLGGRLALQLGSWAGQRSQLSGNCSWTGIVPAPMSARCGRSDATG
ncbi:hypothetical protein QU481_19620 [Crenobacter sp. SG2303]|uniref:Uncharacterized protein n=1 Tax=Crenobacter oryzisoli TaxID=3056844 RepID=A0ABT7XTC8_9NEIS|nr:hypothetical protein [Crenobacter sp. SG2303]MDN0077057.1 hypothetical protein [Crenobacter sp. SG2303]